MALARQTFDHDSPSAPTRALGMLLGTSGVTHPPVQTIGILTGTSSADGSFSDATGYGQIDYDSAGYMYIADTDNNRVQRRVKNAAGAWVHESLVASMGTLLGGGSAVCIVAIDRSVSPNQIHVAAYNHNSVGAWISVWSVADWPNLTTINRLRQYGSNAGSDIAGRAFLGAALTIDDTYAVITSLASPFRVLVYNHLTGALIAQETQSSTYGFTTDGNDNWYSVANAGVETGLWSYNIQTMAGIARLDSAGVNPPRRDRFAVMFGGYPSYYSGRIYLRDYLGRGMAFEPDGDYVDDFIWPGALGSGNFVAGHSGQSANSNAIGSKSNVIVDADGVAWYVAWSANADNAASQSFLTAWPMSTSTATWTKNDFSAGTNTIKSLSLKGTLLAGEKYKIRLRKNAGAWTTVTSDLLQDESVLDFETFTSGDALTVELSISAWDRQDGATGLTATRDKLSPANVAVQMIYEDTVGDVYVPYVSPGFKGKHGGTGAFKGKVGG